MLPRLASAVVNPECRLDHDAGLKQNRAYRVRAPLAEERQRQKLIVALQMLSPGAPAIFYGDEAGLWGADDPDCRKPMLWPDLAYAPETHGPFGPMNRRDPVAVDQALTDFYRKVITLRRSSLTLMHGGYRVLLAQDPERVFAFQRHLKGHQTIAVVCNASAVRQSIASEDLGVDQQWKHTAIVGDSSVSSDHAQCVLGPWSCAVFVRER